MSKPPRKFPPLGPWPNGINNSSRDYRLPANALLDALNVDITDNGDCLIRPGYGVATAITNGHSLSNQGSKVMVCLGSTLAVITGVEPLTITTLRTGMSLLPISYAELAGEVWWSNGAESGRCNKDNSDHPWAVPTPANIPLVFAAGGGTLTAGRYLVAITHSMVDGEESTASSIYLYNLASTGSIVVNLPTAKPGVTNFVVYCSSADGPILQRAATVPAATASVTISANPTGRQIGERAFLAPLPPGEIIAFHNGRLLSAKGDTLSYSEIHDFGLYNPAKGYLRLPGTISIVAPCENGVFIVADKTYWYSGTDIAQAEVFERLPSGAVKGTEFENPLTKGVGWFGADGFVLGAPDGSVSLPQRDNGGFNAPQATSGNTLVRNENGRIHLICHLDDTAAYRQDVSPDFTAARLLYDDDASTVTWNLLSKAGTSRYANWNFNSTAQIGNEYYGMDATGLRKLSGADDDGDQIVAAVHLGRIRFGSPQLKTPLNVYVGGKSSAPLLLGITTSDGRGVYEYPARSFSPDARVHRHDLARGLRDTWFGMSIRNQGGAGMEISEVIVLVADSQRAI